MDNKKIDILNKIGECFLRLNNRDYKKTEELLRSMQISSVEVVSNTKIVIMLRRPGLLIGPKGKSVTALSDFLKMEVKIIEDTQENIYDHLIPRDYQDFM